MIRFVADENFNNDIIRGVLRRNPQIDIIRFQDTNMVGASDPALIAWAAEAGRIILAHDFNTLINYAYERVKNGLPMAGVIEIKRQAPINLVIEDLLIAAGASDLEDWINKVDYFPMRRLPSS